MQVTLVDSSDTGTVSSCVDARRGVGVAVAAVAALLIAALGLTWGCAGVLATVQADGPVSYDAVLILVVVAIAWVALSWLAVVVLLTALAVLPGTVGWCAQQLSRWVVPRAARQTAALFLGIGIVTGPVVVATPASANVPASAAPALGAASAEPLCSAAPAETGRSGTTGLRAAADAATGEPLPRVPELPVLDRPVAAHPPAATAPAPSPRGDHTVAPAPRARPTVSWVPSAPARQLPSADAAAARVLAPPPHSEPALAEVVVRRGDSLWEIAARTLPAGSSAADVAREWPRWYAANRAVIGADPDFLLPGQVLQRPG